ncbi:MAG: hypothetical protein ACE5J7_00650 [Candidatus Aenigmatarchaeota archaeon]
MRLANITIVSLLIILVFISGCIGQSQTQIGPAFEPALSKICAEGEAEVQPDLEPGMPPEMLLIIEECKDNEFNVKYARVIHLPGKYIKYYDKDGNLIATCLAAGEGGTCDELFDLLTSECDFIDCP